MGDSRFCPQCGTLRTGALSFCRNCGYNYDAETPSPTSDPPSC